MTRWLSVMAAFWFANASAQFIRSLTGAITNEVASIKDPVDKTVVAVGFSQCKHVKKLVGVSYDQYDGDEPDLNKLALDFITPEIKIEYNLTSLIHIQTIPYFNVSRGISIFLHGFTDDPTQHSFQSINNAFFKLGNYNILALDASSLIKWLYLRSSTMVRFIGEALGTVLAVLIKQGLDPNSIHLIGHSLGSHIASFTGKTVYKLSGKRVGRISGLDPAGPCFADVDSTLKLDKADAIFVDVIHTDAGVYGLDEQIGHVDFYPNSGSEQPECLLQTCSHSRAWEYYGESMHNLTDFPAVSCDSWKAFKNEKCNYDDTNYMGYNSTPRNTTKRYYLQTSGTSPFALGTGGITHSNTDGVVRTIRDQLNIWKR